MQLLIFGQKVEKSLCRTEMVFDGSRQTVAKGSVPSFTGMCHSSCTGKGSTMRSAEETISVAAYLHGFAPLLGLN